MIILDAEQTALALPYANLVECLRECSAEIVVPERQHHSINIENRADRTLITMPAWDHRGGLGVKLVNIVPDNSERDLPSIQALYVIFDSDTGRPAIMLDGPELTARRTAAVSALAADCLASSTATTHLVVGSGAVARKLPGAFGAVRKIERTLVWARNPQKAAKLAETLREDGFNAEATVDLRRASREADIVSCATMAAKPILHGSWLKPGVHVDLIGSYLPHMREASDSVLIGAEIWVDSLPGAVNDSGELAIPLREGVIKLDAVRGDLLALLEREQSETINGARSVFKSVGNARWDFLCARRAQSNLKPPRKIPAVP